MTRDRRREHRHADADAPTPKAPIPGKRTRVEPAARAKVEPPPRPGLLDRGLDAAKRAYAAGTEWAGEKIEDGKHWVGDKVEAVERGYAAVASSDVGWSDGVGHVDADLDMWASALPAGFRDALVRDGGGDESNNRARLEVDTHRDRVSLRVPALRLAGLQLGAIVARGVEIDDMVLSVDGAKGAASGLAKDHVPSVVADLFVAEGRQSVRLKIGRVVASGVRGTNGLHAGTIVASNLDIVVRSGESGLEGALGSAQGVSTSFELGSLAVTSAKHAAGSLDAAAVHGLSGRVDPAHARGSVKVDDVTATGVQTRDAKVGSAAVHGFHAAADLDGDAPAMTGWRAPAISERATGEAAVGSAKASGIRAHGMSAAGVRLTNLAASKDAQVSARLGGISATGLAGGGARVKSVEASGVGASMAGGNVSGSIDHVRARQARASAGSIGQADAKKLRFEHGARDHVSVGGLYASDLATKDLEAASVGAADLEASAAGAKVEGRAGWVGVDGVSQADKPLVDRATVLDAHAHRDGDAISGGVGTASVENVSIAGAKLDGARVHGVDGSWAAGGAGAISIADANAHGLDAHSESTAARMGWVDAAGIAASTAGGGARASIEHAGAGSLDVHHELAAKPREAAGTSPVDLASARASGSVRLGGEITSATGGGSLMHERAGDNTMGLHANGLDDLAVTFVRMLVGRVHVDLGGATAGVERASASGGLVEVHDKGGGHAVHGKIGAVEVDGVTASKEAGAPVAAKAGPSPADLAGLVRDADLHGSVGLTPKRYGGPVLGATIDPHTRADAAVQVRDGKLVPDHTSVSIRPGVDLPGWFTADGVGLEADREDPSKGRVRPRLGGLPDVDVTGYVPGMETGVPLDVKELAKTITKPEPESKP